MKSVLLLAVAAFFLFQSTNALSWVSDTTKVYVKLHDDLPVEAHNQRLDTREQSATINSESIQMLNALPGARWTPVHAISSSHLRELRSVGEARTGKSLPDLAVEFFVTIDADRQGLSQVLAQLESNPLVEYVNIAPGVAPLPVPGDFQQGQYYLNDPQDGIGATTMWSTYGASGAWAHVAVVEYCFNDDHQDLPSSIPIFGYPQFCTSNHRAHGTATMGILASLANGWGTTGIAHSASFLFSSALSAAGGWNAASAITTAASQLPPGGIILVNLQQEHDQTGELVPVEYYLQEYNAIKTAVANGYSVVIAAGNGNQSLDAAVNAPGSNNHYPFQAANSSGAIYVGAGAPPGYTVQAPRSRLEFSNYGSRLDLQGQGAWVVTTGGNADLYSAEGVNLHYTQNYNGTSSAAPIVTGAVALLQSAHVIAVGTHASPQVVRETLVSTGSAQTAGPLGSIGPLPSVTGAMYMLNTSAPSLTVQDYLCLGNGSASWSSVSTADTYQLRAYSEFHYEYDAYVGANTSTGLSVSETTHYRVRACVGSIGSGQGCTPWSITSGPIQYHPICH